MVLSIPSFTENKHHLLILLVLLKDGGHTATVALWELVRQYFRFKTRSISSRREKRDHGEKSALCDLVTTKIQSGVLDVSKWPCIQFKLLQLIDFFYSNPFSRSQMHH